MMVARFTFASFSAMHFAYCYITQLFSVQFTDHGMRYIMFDPTKNAAVKVFYLPTDAQLSCFKRILKFTLKQLLHVWIQSPSSGSVLFELC
jgi:hypothetical protein